MLETPTKGEVWVDGKNLTAMSEQELRNERKHIGMIFQHFNLLSHRTVYENIAFPLELAGLSKAEEKERIEPILELVGLTQRRDNYPAQLSGGQKQRVGIARALAASPDILLADEPFSAVDAITRGSLQDEIKRIHRQTGITVLFVTHDIDEALDLGDKVLVMEAGRAVQFAEPCDILRNPATEFVDRLVTRKRTVYAR